MASSGTIKSWMYSASDGDTAWWALDWTATTTGMAAGYTKINYTLYK
jgi:hypothetical protein